MPNKKKITFVTHLYYPAKGGAENLAGDLAELIKEDENYRVRVVTSNAYSTEAFFSGDKRRVEKLDENINGIQISRKKFSRKFRILLNLLFNIGNRFKYPGRDFIKLLRYGPRNREIYREILSDNPDLIITLPFPMLNTYYACKAAQVLKRPLMTVPCFHVQDRYGFHNKKLYKILNHSNVIIALTASEKRFFTDELKINKRKIFVIPPPVEVDGMVFKDKRNLKNRYGIKEDCVVLYLGQHSAHKNIVNILSAMPYVWQNYPNTALAIAGGTSSYTKKLKEEAERLTSRNSKKVYFFDDFKEDIKYDLYQLSDIFISLSEYESFGIVFIEAMKNGLPLIGSGNSVAKTIINEFRNGILVNSFQCTEVAGAIIELIDDESIRKKYGDNSLKMAKKKYEKKNIRDKILRVIKKTI